MTKDNNDNIENPENEISEEQKQFVLECASAAASIIGSMAEKEGVGPLDLRALKERYNIVIGEQAEDTKKLINYCSFLEGQLLHSMTSDIVRARLMQEHQKNNSCENESCDGCNEDGISNIDFDFDGRKEE